MESLILKATNHVKHVSKRKVNVENILHEIKRSGATNLDKDTLQVEIDQMIIKGLIDENYKVFNKDILHLTEEPPVDEVHFVFDNDTEENQTSNISFTDTQETPFSNFEENLRNRYSLKLHQDKEFDDINAKIMDLKALFMDEIYTLRQDLSSMQEKLHQTINLNENNNICPKDNNAVDKLKVKLQFLEKENLSLKEEAKRKQNIIQSILDQNAELLKLNNSYVNNSVSQYVESGSRNNEKNQENSSRQISEKLKLKSGQRKDLQDNKENKKHSQVKWKKQEKKNIYIVGDSMLKNITGSGLSKDHTVKIRPHPGATTVDMIDYIKPELRHKPDIVILHCGTNDITNDVNTVKKMKKLVKEIEENDGSTDIVISGLIKRFNHNAIDDIERINEKLK